MIAEKITLEAIEQLEAEGLGGAVNAIAELLSSPDGLGKHGVQGWVALTRLEVLGKAMSHLGADLKGMRRDKKSGRLSIVHFGSRVLQLIARDVRSGT